jgi:hypothetical protein
MYVCVFCVPWAYNTFQPTLRHLHMHEKCWSQYNDRVTARSVVLESSAVFLTVAVLFLQGSCCALKIHKFIVQQATAEINLPYLECGQRLSCWSASKSRLRAQSWLYLLALYRNRRAAFLSIHVASHQMHALCCLLCLVAFQMTLWCTTLTHS